MFDPEKFIGYYVIISFIALAFLQTFFMFRMQRYLKSEFRDKFWINVWYLPHKEEWYHSEGWKYHIRYKRIQLIIVFSWLLIIVYQFFYDINTL